MKKISLFSMLLVAIFFVIGSVASAAENLALNKMASQSSEHPNYKQYEWSADKVVDGNTDGDIWKASVCHTNVENQPWWQVDLGTVHNFDKISIWNRTDDGSENLSDFYVFVSNKNISLSHSTIETILKDSEISAYYVAQAGTQIDIEDNFSGRYVRIQLKADNHVLFLAEVEVWTDLPPAFEVCTQAELDAKYEAGKKYCIENPGYCGISTTGEYTQADLDAKYQEGYSTGCTACSDGTTTTPATISPELKMHIPALQYVSPFGAMDLWADFEYAGESNGDILWKLSDFGQK